MALAPEAAGTALALEAAGTALAPEAAGTVPAPDSDQVPALVPAGVAGSCDSGCRHIRSRWVASEWGNHLETRIFSLCITTPSDSYWRE